MLSPRDFALISRWRAEGVPLGAVLEALGTAGRHGRLRGPVTLARAASAVGDAWAVIRTGRAPGIQGRAPGAISLQEARRRWESASRREAAGSGLRELLTSLVRRMDAGEEPERLDLDLDRELPMAVSGALLAEADTSVRARVTTQRRPAQEVPDRTARRAVVDRLRRSLDLPRLALCEAEQGHDPRSPRKGAPARTPRRR